MLKQLCIVIGVCGLAACGDPLAGIDRISDVELAETDPVANALPSDAEVAREGFFSTDATQPSNAEAEPTEAAETPPSPRRGLMGLFRGKAPAATIPTPLSGPSSTVTTEDQALTLAVESAAVSANNQTDVPAPQVKLASLEPKNAPQRRGLFGRPVPAALISTKSDDVTDVAYGTILPYGMIARSCEARRKPLGCRIESASARGFKLYDSDPGGTGSRTYYITGFDDGCPRQLTAANVLLGAPSRYEQLHYGPTGKDLAYAETDKAYDKLKRKVCGTRKRKPCGRKIDKMDKSTFFVTSYARFDDNTRWSEALIHDGIVMASALKSHR
jgi:hypothetical protein